MEWIRSRHRLNREEKLVNRMKKTERTYEPHLAVREFSVPPGGEWSPRSPGWSLIQIGRGTGYFLQPQSSLELETGTALLVAGPTQGSIRASQLGGLFLYSFSVTPARLTGLITMGEQDFLEQAAFRKEFSLRILSPRRSGGDENGGTLRRRKLERVVVSAESAPTVCRGFWQ